MTGRRAGRPLGRTPVPHLLRTRAEIDACLWANYREFRTPEMYFGGIDNNQDPPERFDTADLRILTVFFSNGRIRAAAQTFSVLHELAQASSQGRLFMDYSYFPEVDDLPLHARYGLPTLFGNVSHAPVRDYDLVLLSHATYSEIVNIPYALVHAGIPLSIDERLADPELPLLLLGGSFAHATFVLFGSFAGGRCLADGAYYGQGQGIVGEVVEELRQRHVQQSITREKRATLDFLMTESTRRAYFFNPRAYQWVPQTASPLLLDRIERVDPRAPAQVAVSRTAVVPRATQKVFHLTGFNHDAHALYLANGCDAHACTFCSEGNLAGPYVERPAAEVLRDVEAMKRHAAPTTLSFIAYNPTDHRQFSHIVLGAAQHVSRVSYSTPRIDIVAACPEQMALFAALGAVGITLAVEGMSERIRGRLLNKNLTLAQMQQAVRNVFQHPFTQLKFSVLLTGTESNDDIEEWVAFLRWVRAERDQLGQQCQLVVTHNPLIMFDHTPLRWMPRHPARLSWDGERRLDDYIQSVYRLGVVTKFNNRGPATLLEQLFSDAGPFLTEFLIRLSCDEGLVIDNTLASAHWVPVRRCFAALGLDPSPVFAEKPLDAVMPVDVLAFTTPALFTRWQQQHHAQDFSHPRCLRTPAHRLPVCSACGYCHSPAERRTRTARALEEPPSPAQVLEGLASSRPVDWVRIVAQVHAPWELIHKDALSHIVTARLLQAQAALADRFYVVGKHSLTWVSQHYQRGWYRGTFAVDVAFRDVVDPGWLDEARSTANASLRSCQLRRIDHIDHRERLERAPGNSLLYLVSLPDVSATTVQCAFARWDGMVPVAVRAKGFAPGERRKAMPELVEQIFVTASPEGGSRLALVLPSHVHPIGFLARVLGVATGALLRKSEVTLQEHFRQTSSPQGCACGTPVQFSVFSHRQPSRCPRCVAQRYLFSWGAGATP